MDFKSIGEDIKMLAERMEEVSNTVKESREAQDNMAKEIDLLRVDNRQLKDKSNELDSRLSLSEGTAALDNLDLAAESKKSDQTRRETVFMREIAENNSLADRRQIVVNMPPPPHNHIYLRSMQLHDFIKFVLDWFEYQSSHGIRLEPSTIISASIRNTLCDKHALKENIFHNMTPEEFCNLMAKETQVRSKLEFSQVLKHALQDYRRLPWDKVKPNNHHIFYNGVLRRKKVFTKTFQIMMEHNSSKCPDVEGKDYGLAYTFLNMIDEDYNKTILADMPKINNTNYKKIDDFINVYVEKVREQYETSKTVRMIPYKGEDFKYLGYKRTAEENTGSGQQEQYRKSKHGKTNFHRAWRRKQEKEKRPNHLNYIKSSNEFDTEEEIYDHYVATREEDHVSDESDGGACYQTPGDDSDSEEDLIYDKAELDSNEGFTWSGPEVDRLKEEARIATAKLNAMEERKDRLASLRIPREEPEAPHGCVNYAIYGKCYRDSQCKYASTHNEMDAKETRKWITKKMTSTEGAVLKLDPRRVHFLKSQAEEST